MESYDNVYKAAYCIVFVNTVRISATLPKDQIDFIRSNSYSASRLLQNVVIDLMNEKKSQRSVRSPEIPTNDLEVTN